MLVTIRSDGFKATVNRLAGYQADETTGQLVDMRMLFPSLKRGRRASKADKTA